MKIFYAANIDHTCTGCYAYDENETYLDATLVGTVLTFIEYGWKEGTVKVVGGNDRYSYYEIETDNLELV
jgi:hypothetical protein